MAGVREVSVHLVCIGESDGNGQIEAVVDHRPLAGDGLADADLEHPRDLLESFGDFDDPLSVSGVAGCLQPEQDHVVDPVFDRDPGPVSGPGIVGGGVLHAHRGAAEKGQGDGQQGCCAPQMPSVIISIIIDGWLPVIEPRIDDQGNRMKVSLILTNLANGGVSGVQQSPF